MIVATGYTVGEPYVDFSYRVHEACENAVQSQKKEVWSLSAQEFKKKTICDLFT